MCAALLCGALWAEGIFFKFNSKKKLSLSGSRDVLVLYNYIILMQKKSTNAILFGHRSDLVDALLWLRP